MVSIVIVILLSGIYLFRSYVFESNDFAINTKINQISNLIINKARKIYYYGLSSRTTLNIDMPNGINNVYILSLKGGNETYLVFKFNSASGEKKILYDSLVPLNTNDCSIKPDDLCDENDCKCLPDIFFREGLKNVALEVISNCKYNYFDGNNNIDVYKMSCVNISLS